MNKLTILRLSKVSILRQCLCFFLETIMQRSREKNNLQKRMNMIHSPQTHILFSRKRKQRSLILTRWILVTLGQNEIDHHFHYAKKIRAKSWCRAKIRISKRWNMWQPKTPNPHCSCFGVNKQGLLFTDLPLKKI